MSLQAVFNFSLTPTPKNINKARPPDDINKIALYNKPTSKTNRSTISKIARVPNFNPIQIDNHFSCL
jgi:hypothetical protein